MTLPQSPPTRLAEIPDGMEPAALAAAFRSVAHAWEIGFLEDVVEAAASRKAYAYRMSVNGELGPLVVDWKLFENATPCGPLAQEQAGRSKARAKLASLTWEQKYENDRILARSGAVDVGAIFPDGGDGRCAGWSFWLNGIGVPLQQRARSVEAAKKALAKRWLEFLAKARLEPAS